MGSNLHGLKAIDQRRVGLRICPVARGLYSIRRVGRAEAELEHSNAVTQLSSHQ
jgi:hypothetical protein